MKKFTLLTVLAAFVAAFSFTSCNTDGDSYTPLTLEQQKSFQAAMAVGSYNDMMLLFEKKNEANVNKQIDSVAVSCRVSMNGDSTITMTNFPIAQLAEHISNPNLAKALAKEAPRTITCKYQVAPNSTSAMAYFLAYPSVIELNLTYGTDNKSHKVQFVFAPNQMYYGYCTLNEPRQLGFQFYLAQLWVDGAQTSYLKNSVSGYSSVSFACRNAFKKSK